MKKADLKGRTFERLLVLSEAEKRGAEIAWNRRCDCGNEHVAISRHLILGSTRSCGCLRLEQRTTHGLSQTRGYQAWISMHRRCYSPSDNRYQHYGGRGIVVCAEWHSVEGFIDDMGQPGVNMTLDREDVNGNYSPGNCRWMTNADQQRNRRNNRLITSNGITKPLAVWAAELGLPESTIRNRLKRGSSNILGGKSHV